MTQMIRDLIYFDFEKAASIYSQFEGGLRERLEVTEDAGKDRSAGAKFGVPKIAEAKLGVEYIEKTSTLETKILHHDLLTRVESQLNTMNLVADIRSRVEEETLSAENIRKSIGKKPYIIASGWSVIEDYRRILSISQKFNEITKFIARCATEAVKQSSEYQDLQLQIDAARQSAKTIKDRNKKAQAKLRLKTLEQSINSKVKSELSGVDQYLLDGIQLWIDTFMPNRINFRIYPFDEFPSFQVLCNLKRECFVDQNLEHLLYGYGSRPNVPLAVFGLITSMPSKEGHKFDPLAEFKELEEKEDKTAFEESFRGIFSAMDEIEASMRYSRYPNLTVHPIAVFRQFEALDNK
jgi:hypothetical protein